MKIKKYEQGDEMKFSEEDEGKLITNKNGEVIGRVVNGTVLIPEVHSNQKLTQDQWSKIVNNYAIKHPLNVFNDSFYNGRKYITDDTWRIITKDLPMSSPLWNKVPSKNRSQLKWDILNSTSPNKPINFINASKNFIRNIISSEARNAETYDSNKFTFEQAYENARRKGNKTFYWNDNYYNTDYSGVHHKQYEEDLKSGKAQAWEQQYPGYLNPELRKAKLEEIDTYGITNEQTQNEDFFKTRIKSAPDTYKKLNFSDMWNFVFNTLKNGDERFGKRYLFGYPVMPGAFKISKFKPTVGNGNTLYYYGDWINEDKKLYDLGNLVEVNPETESVETLNKFDLLKKQKESEKIKLIHQYFTEHNLPIPLDTSLAYYYLTEDNLKNVKEEDINNFWKYYENALGDIDNKYSQQLDLLGQNNIISLINFSSPKYLENKFVANYSKYPLLSNNNKKVYLTATPQVINPDKKYLKILETSPVIGRSNATNSYKIAPYDENLGDFTTTITPDYTSFYDLWDLDLFRKQGNDTKIKLGKPFEFYDRSYLNGKTPNIDLLYDKLKF